jgi:hypothetical protein
MARPSRLLVAAAWIAGASLVAIAADEPVAADPPGIPPGQEDLLLDMLGKGVSLPGGCKVGDGRVLHTVVEMSYSCSRGDVVVELAHSSQALESEVQTRHFALSVLDGSAPASLIDVLSARILEREDEFEWVMPAEAARAAD